LQGFELGLGLGDGGAQVTQLRSSPVMCSPICAKAASASARAVSRRWRSSRWWPICCSMRASSPLMR
jgi:hypothetical protein